MNAYYLNENYEYIETGFAPTGRAKCKACKEPILLESLRIGEIWMSDHFSSKHYFHCECYRMKPRFKHIDAEKQLFQLDKLDKKSQKLVLKHVKDEVRRLNGGGKPPVTEKSKSKPKTTGRGKSAPKEEVKVVPPKKGGKSKSKPKAKSRGRKEEREASKEIEKQNNSRSARAASRLTKREDPPAKKSSRSESKKSVKSVPKKAIKKLKKAPVSQGGYTAAQKAQFKKLVKEFCEKSASQLKEILAANNQTKTGNKLEMAEKCADGQILGKIPMCSNCGGGRPRFNRNIGVYTCNGYMDDDHFRNCHKTFTMDEIKRDPWVN